MSLKCLQDRRIVNNFRTTNFTKLKSNQNILSDILTENMKNYKWIVGRYSRLLFYSYNYSNEENA